MTKSKGNDKRHIRCIRSLSSEEMFGLTIQIRRCAVSIPSNIAEGSGRNTVKYFLYYINIGLGSAYELEQIILAFDLPFKEKMCLRTLLKEFKKIQKMLFGLKKNKQ